MSCWIAALPLSNVSVPIPGGPRQILGNERSPFLAPASVSAHFRAFAAEGCDGIGLFPTIWLTQLALSTGVYALSSVRLASFLAYLPTLIVSGGGSPSVALFLLLFDQPALPGAGDVPVVSMALPYAGGPAALPSVNSNLVQPSMGQTRAFGRGLSWGVSIDPFVFSPPASPPEVFTSAEFAS